MNQSLASAIVEGAVSLAGLLLVFSGFLFSQAVSFPPETPDATINKYRSAAKHAVWPFAGCLAVALLAGLALRNSSPELLEWAWRAFFVLVLGTGLYGWFVIIFRLSRD